MVPKRDVSKDSVHVSDMFSFFTSSWDHKALLRSQGNRYRDGRWTIDGDGSFHAFRHKEQLGRGELRTIEASEVYLDGTDYRTPSSHVYNWRPTIGQEVSSSSIFGDPNEHVDHPPVVEDAYEDYVLELNARGTAFIKRYRPGNPLINVGQFVLELRDLPRIPLRLFDRAKFFNSIGSEYLNVEFGWKPFLKDLWKLYRLQRYVRSKLDELIKGNGLTIRRRSKKRVSEPLTTYFADGTLSKPFGPLFDESIGGSSQLDKFHVFGPTPPWYQIYGMTGSCSYNASLTVKQTDWECGNFRYYVPNIGSDQWTARATSTLFETNVTPSLIWEVYPWSWLIDWFTNVGDIISNLSNNAVDNETLTNCFAMTRVSKVTEIAASPTWDQYVEYQAPNQYYDTHLVIPAGTDYIKYVSTETNLLRRQASPFGFGIDFSGFSARQIAILAALGVTRGKH